VLIKLQSGKTYTMGDVLVENAGYNLAIFEIRKGSSAERFSYLKLADSDAIEAGNTVYTIGSPRELINSMTEGIVAHTGRTVDGNTLVTITAPISFSSGGTPVLNTLGQVVGIASMSYTSGQNLNLAVPVNQLREVFRAMLEERPDPPPDKSPFED
jgi:S1-C subfamily serine protease